MTKIDIKGIIENINELQEDNTVPRNIKERLKEVAEILQSKETSSIKINKALDKLEEIADDVNIQPYTRTQIWNLASMLEALGNGKNK
ncbi:MAG: UPF0147 family protein [Candidatus Woesearchaeota archaeon]|nr:UPF0147 family protein [Candidatus Woesearchaeota archaeon]